MARALRRRDGARGIVLAGGAGVGKTRLAREAVAAATRSGAQARWAVATDSARSVPLGCFAHLLRHLDPAAPSAVRRAADELMTDAPDAGVVIGVDDAHLLDDMSATLVQELVAQGAPVVVTLRSGEPTPAAVDGLWRDGPVARLDVQALSADDTAALLGEVLEGPIEAQTADRLWKVTAGNALYLRHLVDGEIDAGRLHRTSGVWHWRGDLALCPPLRELVDARIGPLEGAVRRVVELVALAEPIGVTMLSGLVEPDALLAAQQRRLITITVDGMRTEARLAHPLHGEAVREDLLTLRARRLRGELAAALAATGCRRHGDLLRLARLEIASDRPADPGLLVRAAVEANRLGAIDLAERFSRAAKVAGAGFESELMLGYSRGWQGHPEDAADRMAAAVALAGTPEQHVRAALAQASLRWWGFGDGPAAEAILQRALVANTVDELGDELRAILALLALYAGRANEAAASAQALLERGLARGGVRPRVATFAGDALAIATAVLGRPDDAEAAIAPALAAAVQLPESAVLRAGIWCGHLLGLRLAGRLAAADTASAGYLADAGTSPLMRSKAAVYRAGVLIDQGRLAEVVVLLRDTIAGLDGNDAADWIFLCQQGLATALGMAGDAARAGTALRAAHARHRPTLAFSEPDLRIAEAWVAAAEGAVTQAVAAAREAGALAAQREQPAVEVMALHTAVRFGDRTAAARLTELAAGIHTPLPAVAAAHAVALVDGDGRGLDDVATRLAELGAPLLAADAAAQAASAHARRGRQGSAALSASRARKLGAGGRTPALRAVADSLPITGREREIATLVASGLSNHAIAERLAVSVRTVEGHIYRACAKLEVSDRAALAARVRSAG